MMIAPLTASLDAAERDERFAHLSVSLGERHLGMTWPNPSVGAVVVAEIDGAPIVVGCGITQAGGRPHAEPLALAMAAEAARGATLYVSLEPCSHTGKTPPCVDAVIASGIARVVAAIEDPDPRVSGQGLARLREAGIITVSGLARAEAARAHRGHIMRVTRERPAVTLKLARTADGYAGRHEGPRLMISGEIANGRVHLMRAHADAILVGAGTVMADDPLLTVRLPGLEERSPVRVVVDSGLRLPVGARVFDAGTCPTWVITSPEASPDSERRLRDRGVDVLRLRSDPNQEAGLRETLRLLANKGISRVFCEGGPRLAEALASADLIDEIALLTGAGTLGGGGIPALGPNLSAALSGRFRHIDTEHLGPDRLDRFERDPENSAA